MSFASRFGGHWGSHRACGPQFHVVQARAGFNTSSHPIPYRRTRPISRSGSSITAFYWLSFVLAAVVLVFECVRRWGSAGLGLGFVVVIRMVLSRLLFSLGGLLPWTRHGGGIAAGHEPRSAKQHVANIQSLFGGFNRCAVVQCVLSSMARPDLGRVRKDSRLREQPACSSPMVSRLQNR